MAAGYRLDIDESGIATLMFDLPGRVNIMNDDFLRAMAAIMARLAQPGDGLTGLIIGSAKKSFFAGGDLTLMGRARPGQEAFLFGHFELLKSYFRAIEKLGVPVVAALGGSALGGGFELALSCHHRIAVRRDDLVIGLPEIGFAILPGAGGVVRLVRLIGLGPALGYLLTGKQVTADVALADGLIDAVVDDEVALLVAARRWIQANPCAAQPWDVAAPSSIDGFAARRIVELAQASLALDVDTALERETRALVDLMVRPEAATRIEAFFAAQRSRIVKAPP